MLKVDHIADKAEGRCCGIPYNTELVNINGVCMHFWVGDRPMTPDLAAALQRAGRNQRDVVRFQYCEGEPTGFWANSDFGKTI